MKNLNELSQAVHENAVKHGWWERDPSIEHCLMLVVTEVAEMVEADRAGRYSNLERTNIGPATNTMRENLREAIETSKSFHVVFESFIKNTVEDEMADVVIRLLDLAGRLGIDFDKFSPNKYHRAFDRFSFTENAFALTKGLCRENINIFKRIQFGIHYVSEWAKCRGFHLDWHVRAKMRYNATRPFKYGKKY